MLCQRKSTHLVFAAGAVLALSGCAAPQIYTPYSQPQQTFNPGIASHNYTVTAVDTLGKPAKGANVEWKTKANKSEQTYTATTDDNGISTITLTVEPVKSTSISWADYQSEATYSVKKEGYFTTSGRLSENSYYSSSGAREPSPKSAKALMVRPIDYLSSNFAQEKQFAQLRGKVLDFLALIRLESILNEADLKIGGVKLQDFKGKRYLTLELSSDNVFNSLKLDRYAIGKKVFDETVRKTLNPLNDKISDQKLFYGYNVIVNTRIKSFSEEYATGNALRYEFMMPQASVRSYKDKNISGQKLIDDSIVLLNDERIDLKFQ